MRSGNRTRCARWMGMASALALVTAMAAGNPAAAGKPSGGGGGGGSGGGPLDNSGVVLFTGPTASPGVYACSPDGSNKRLLSPSGETWTSYDVSRGHASAPVTVLAGTDNARRICAIAADGSSSPVLLYQATSPAVAHTARFDFAGTRIAFIGASGVAPVVFTIYVADVVRGSAGEVTGITNVAALYQTSSQLFRGLDWSPDGSKIVFTMTYDLWLLDVSTGTASQLTSTSEVEAWPRWSPDGDHIACEQWPSATSMGNGGVIVTVDPSSGAETVVTTKKNGGIAAAYLSYPSWSSDSGVLLYHAHDSNKSDLWQVASNGSGKAVNATNDGATTQENYPAWGW
jgi:hypothetical protein